jgi:hypothetical protein
MPLADCAQTVHRKCRKAWVGSWWPLVSSVTFVVPKAQNGAAIRWIINERNRLVSSITSWNSALRHQYFLPVSDLSYT